MALSKKLNADPTTGFGTNSKQSGGRFYQKDGSTNIHRKGLRFFDQLSWYHTMLSLPRWKFWFTLVMIYLLINIVFAIIYYAIGIDHFGGIQTGSEWQHFAESFFFSCQTFTTVGYGRISPTGLVASSVAAIEAFMGIISFALASGLFYGRFSRPRSFLKFSHNALIAPYKTGIALMFRTAPYKKTHLSEAEVRLTLAMEVQTDGNVKDEFYQLKVEFTKVNALVLNWTIVHPINEESPLNGLTIDDLKKAQAELFVFIKAYDEGFSNTVIARTSYTADEIIEGARFQPMYYSNEEGNATILDFTKLSAYDTVQLKQVTQQAESV
jgi:inward rectifier potassium channel